MRTACRRIDGFSDRDVADAARHTRAERLVFAQNAGQLYYLLTARYRFVADIRALIAQRYSPPLFTTKPYDLATLSRSIADAVA